MRGWAAGFDGGRPLMMLLETPPMTLEVNQLEAHSGVTQSFFPAGRSAAVLVVAPPTEAGVLPRREDARAFLLDGTAGYVLHKNTWHSLDRLPIGEEPTRWIMITDTETQRDLAGVEHGAAKLTRMIDLEAEWGDAVRIRPATAQGAGA